MTDQTAGIAATDGLPIETLQAVVELQRAELNRLLREQSRLNDRIDSLLQLYEREQVLRQQMQVSLDRLALVHAGVHAGAHAGAAQQQAALTHEAAPDVDDLRVRLARTEDRFTALQGAVGDLIGYIERKLPIGDGAEASASFVRVFAPT